MRGEVKVVEEGGRRGGTIMDTVTRGICCARTQTLTKMRQRDRPHGITCYITLLNDKNEKEIK